MNIQNEEQWNQAFFKACSEGCIKDVKSLGQKKYLDQGWADIHSGDELGFRMACEKGHLEVVKYLLTSPELIEAGHTFANLHAVNEAGFRWACAYGHLEIVKYLLTSHQLKEAGHTLDNLHADREEGFRWACENKRWDVVRWLVMDYEIEKTPAIDKIIEDYPQAQEYFRVREELQEMKEIMLMSAKLSSEELRSDKRVDKKAKKL